MDNSKDGGTSQGPSDPDQAMGVSFPSTVSTLKPQIDQTVSEVQKQLADIDFDSSDAGLQQRLKDQEGNISGLRSTLMKLELENETLLLEIEALKKHNHEREQVLSDAKEAMVRQRHQRDQVLSDLDEAMVRERHQRDQVLSDLDEAMVRERHQRDQVLSDLNEALVRQRHQRNQVLSDLDEPLVKKCHKREQSLSDVKVSFMKQLEDKDKIIGDLRKELLNRELMINQLQEQHNLPGPQGTAKANEMKREATSFMNSSRSRNLKMDEARNFISNRRGNLGSSTSKNSARTGVHCPRDPVRTRTFWRRLGSKIINKWRELMK